MHDFLIPLYSNPNHIKYIKSCDSKLVCFFKVAARDTPKTAQNLHNQLMGLSAPLEIHLRLLKINQRSRANKAEDVVLWRHKSSRNCFNIHRDVYALTTLGGRWVEGPDKFIHFPVYNKAPRLVHSIQEPISLHLMVCHHLELINRRLPRKNFNTDFVSNDEEPSSAFNHCQKSLITQNSFD